MYKQILDKEKIKSKMKIMSKETYEQIFIDHADEFKHEETKNQFTKDIEKGKSEKLKMVNK